MVSNGSGPQAPSGMKREFLKNELWSKVIRLFCLMVSNGARKRLPFRSKSFKWEMGDMDAPIWLRLVTFGYARLRRATRIDIWGWADFEARKTYSSVISNQLSEGISGFPVLPAAALEKRR